MDVDFVTHEHGVAGSWALRAKVGCVGLRGSRHVRDVFAVDEAALGRWLEGLRAGVKATAYIVGESRDYPLPTAALLDVHWLTLAEALAAHAFPDTEGFVWVAGERDLIRPARRFLKELGVVNMDHHPPTPRTRPGTARGRRASCGA
ncbi:siderophore-interacting protein [Corynebacterium incognita]|uniref:siderophore-interacting protein n=1 Tax=Corynebacterium incognita TaxID=2754725 RepID=UPI0016273EEC|nr:siderophore-interacting protein [Corynebacterium incognita]